MEIVDVEIAPLNPAQVTPLELVEDFADVAPGWHFLEEDSRLYEAVRGRPACVIRSCNRERSGTVDYAFAGHPGAGSLSLRLAILCPPDDVQPISGEGRSSCLELFLNAFQQYLQGRGELVRISPIAAREAEAVSARAAAPRRRSFIVGWSSCTRSSPRA